MVAVTLTGEKPCELREVVDDWADDDRIIESGRDSEFGDTVDPCRYTPSLAAVSTKD